jgi:hypothetical protein
MGHTLRSSGLLLLEASQARVSQSGLKTGGCTVRMVYVAPSQRSRGDEAKDEQINAMGCIRLCYPYFTVFTVLCTRGILVL